jgi:hypothetical protein
MHFWSRHASETNSGAELGSAISEARGAAVAPPLQRLGAHVLVNARAASLNQKLTILAAVFELGGVLMAVFRIYLADGDRRVKADLKAVTKSSLE